MLRISSKLDGLRAQVEGSGGAKNTATSTRVTRGLGVEAWRSPKEKGVWIWGRAPADGVRSGGCRQERELAAGANVCAAGEEPGSQRSRAAELGVRGDGEQARGGARDREGRKKGKSE